MAALHAMHDLQCSAMLCVIQCKIKQQVGRPCVEASYSFSFCCFQALVDVFLLFASASR